MTEPLVTIDIVHEHIHNGRSFIVTDVDTDVDIAGPKRWTIITPDTNKVAHIVWDVFANAAGTLEFFESPTITVAGTTLTNYNMNRNNIETSGIVIAYDPTITVDGTRIWQTRLGTSGNLFVATGGGTGSRMEFNLKKNTTYHMKFTSVADNNLIWINFIWYDVFTR